MSAITLALHLLNPGDVLLAPHDCYGGTYRLMNALCQKGSFDVRFVDQTSPEALEDALTDDVKMVWVETPSNPLLRVVDVEAITRETHRVGAIAVVDNTFLSPVWQPFLGADIVVHSTTKYLNGHSDIVGGALARTPELHEQLAWWANCLG